MGNIYLAQGEYILCYPRNPNTNLNGKHISNTINVISFSTENNIYKKKAKRKEGIIYLTVLSS